MLRWEIHTARVCNGDIPLLKRATATPIQTTTPKTSEEIAASVFSTNGILSIGFTPYQNTRSSFVIAYPDAGAGGQPDDRFYRLPLCRQRECHIDHSERMSGRPC
jgi:hypothetical protein